LKTITSERQQSLSWRLTTKLQFVKTLLKLSKPNLKSKPHSSKKLTLNKTNLSKFFNQESVRLKPTLKVARNRLKSARKWCMKTKVKPKML